LQAGWFVSGQRPDHGDGEADEDDRPDWVIRQPEKVRDGAENSDDDANGAGCSDPSLEVQAAGSKRVGAGQSHETAF
jgi:hypothetical protein